LWFSIGGSPVSDRLPHPRACKYVIKEVVTRGRERLL
jgi:hypothetical protein